MTMIVRVKAFINTHKRHLIILISTLGAICAVFFVSQRYFNKSATLKQQKVLKVEVTTLSKGKLQSFLYLSGQVLFKSGTVADYSPRTKGIVRAVHKKVGDSVSPGTPLATVESNRGLTSYQITSSLSGQVIAQNVNVGEVVTEDTQLFEVADPKSLWVELSANINELSKIKVSQSVELLPSGNFKPGFGSVRYVSPLVDDETGRGLVGVQIEGDSSEWPAGLAVHAKIAVSEIKVARLVPKSAVFHSFGIRYLLVKNSAGFEKRPVEKGREDDSFVEIISGVKEKEEFATSAQEALQDET